MFSSCSSWLLFGIPWKIFVRLTLDVEEYNTSNLSSESLLNNGDTTCQWKYSIVIWKHSKVSVSGHRWLGASLKWDIVSFMRNWNYVSSKKITKQGRHDLPMKLLFSYSEALVNVRFWTVVLVRILGIIYFLTTSKHIWTDYIYIGNKGLNPLSFCP